MLELPKQEPGTCPSHTLLVQEIRNGMNNLADGQAAIALKVEESGKRFESGCSTLWATIHDQGKLITETREQVLKTDYFQRGKDQANDESKRIGITLLISVLSAAVAIFVLIFSFIEKRI